MKFYKSILCISAVSFLYACGKEDPEKKEVKDLLSNFSLNAPFEISGKEFFFSDEEQEKIKKILKDGNMEQQVQNLCKNNLIWCNLLFQYVCVCEEKVDNINVKNFQTYLDDVKANIAQRKKIVDIVEKNSAKVKKITKDQVDNWNLARDFAFDELGGVRGYSDYGQFTLSFINGFFTITFAVQDKDKEEVFLDFLVKIVTEAYPLFNYKNLFVGVEEKLAKKFLEKVQKSDSRWSGYHIIDDHTKLGYGFDIPNK